MAEILLRLKSVESGADSATLPLDPPTEPGATVLATLTEEQADRAMMTIKWFDSESEEVSPSGNNFVYVSMSALRTAGALGPVVINDQPIAIRSTGPLPLGGITPGTWTALLLDWDPPEGATHCAVLLWGWD